MPTPFKPASSQPVNGDRVIFPSEQPRLNPAAPTGPVIQSHNLNGDETFRPSLNSHVSVDNPLGLHGLHSSGMNISKTGADNEDALVFHTYTGSMDGSLGYGVPGLDYNAAVLSMPFNTATSEDTRGNVLAFYPATNGNLKLDPQVDPSYGNEVHLSPHNVLSNHTTGSTHTIKDEPSTGEPSRRPSHTILPTNPGKIPTGSGSQQKAPPPPINTDTQSHHVASGTKSQHGTWRRGNKGRTPLSVKRSQSTPNVQLAAQLAAASAVSAPPVPSASTTDDISPVTLAYQLDKKRNKLGYHRTSVACGHCRRRKIRCILAKDESGRCSNCIRLKKECSFYPVESADRRPRSASKPEISSQIFQDNCSSPSSPTRSPRLSVDQINMTAAYDGSLYPSSLPITPNYECETPTSTFDDTYRNRSLSSSSRVSLAFSNSGSRRPSLAHMFTAPLPSREFRSLSDASPTYMETFSSFSSRFGNATKSIGIGIEDPTSSFWRLENASNNFSPLSQHINFGGMPSLQEDTLKHERLNSVDNGVGPMAQAYAESGLFNVSSDPPLDDGLSNNSKGMVDVQNGQQFLGETPGSFSVDGGYDFSWNQPQKDSANISQNPGLAENWFLPQQATGEMLCDPDPTVQRITQTAVGVKHE